MVCGCAYGFEVILPFFLSTFSTLFYLDFPGPITIRIDTLWAKLLHEFSTDHFETVHTGSTWFVDVHVVLGLSFFYLLSTFFTFSIYLLPGSISIRIDTLKAQLLPQLSTDHFETVHTGSTWS